MTDRNLIKQLKALKEIKPREEWALLTKENLFKDEAKENKSIVSVIIDAIKELQKGERFVFNHKPAFAFSFIAVICIGLFGFAQASVPGDSLFTLKKITEKGQAALISQKDKTKFDFQMVSKRLDDLARVAESNSSRNLSPAINEYKQTASGAVKNLAESNDIKEIAGGVKKLEQNEEKIKSLGVEIGENADLDNALLNVVQREITSYESAELTEGELGLLSEAKMYFSEGRYSEALEKLIEIGK
jgi:hypothetical protein